MKRNLLLLCLLCATHFAFGQCMSRHGMPVTPDYLETHRLTSSGSAALDSTISKVTPVLLRVYGFSSQVYFVKDDKNSYANAHDHNIYLGVSLLQELYSKPNGRYNVAFIVAHELGHIYQYQDTAHSQMWHDPNRDSFELQADFLAGHVLCKSGIVTKAFGDQVYQVVQDLGDFDFYNTAHHGTPGQRAYIVELGISFGDLSYMENTLQTSNTYINPGDFIKTFNDQQVFAWAHLYKQGRAQFGGRDELYINSNNEIFVRDSGKFIRAGFSRLMPNSYSTNQYEIQLPGTSTVIQCTKDDFQKVRSVDGSKIGEFNLMLKYLSQGAPPPLIANLNTHKQWICPGDGSPAIALNGNILYLSYRDHAGHIHLCSGNDVTSMTTIAFDGVSDNDPVVACLQNNLYVAWMSDDRKSIIVNQVPANGSPTQQHIISITEELSGRLAMASYEDRLYIAFKNTHAQLGIIHSSNGAQFSYCTGLGFTISDSPKLFPCFGDLLVGAKEQATGLFFQMRTGGDGEFYQKEELPVKNNSSEFAAGENAMPMLFIVEPIYAWIKDDNLYFNPYMQQRPVSLSSQASQTPALMYPFIAFRGSGDNKDLITLAKIGRD